MKETPLIVIEVSCCWGNENNPVRLANLAGLAAPAFTNTAYFGTLNLQANIDENTSFWLPAGDLIRISRGVDAATGDRVNFVPQVVLEPGTGIYDSDIDELSDLSVPLLRRRRLSAQCTSPSIC